MDNKAEHICVVVKDMDKTIEYYSRVFGIGPFHKMEATPKKFMVRGEPSSLTIKIAHAWLGDFQLELIEAEPGENVFWEFFQRHGEALHHISFNVDNLEAELAQLAEKGVKLLLSGETDYGTKFAYLDTADSAGTIMELTQRSGGFGIPAV